MRFFLKNNKGLAMPLAVFLIFVVAILTTALYTYSSTDMLRLNLNKDVKKAEYLAKTGVEVTIKAWQGVLTNTMVPRETLPVYMLEDGTFVTPEEYESPPENTVGYYMVRVDPNETKIYDENEIRVINFEATAVVGNATAKASAYTVMSLNAYEHGWYNSNGTPIETGMESIDSTVVSSGLWWGGTSSTEILGHIFPGNITFPQPSESSPVTLKLNANQKIAYVGKSLYFDMPITLRNGTGSKNVLILSGSDIILNGDVELYAYYGLSNVGIGTLVLSVLEDYEHDDPYTAEENNCGKVYFGGDVYITINSLFGGSRTKLFSKGDVYYFKGGGGLDLVKYYIDNNGTGSMTAYILSNLYPSTGIKYDRSYMRRINPDNSIDEPSDFIPPHPDEEGTVIWQ